VPRYVVERTFPAGRLAPAPEGGSEARQDAIEGNTVFGVTWVHSYVSEDGERSLGLYDAPNPEAIRRASRRNSLPVDRITQVRVLEPYPYKRDRS